MAIRSKANARESAGFRRRQVRIWAYITVQDQWRGRGRMKRPQGVWTRSITRESTCAWASWWTDSADRERVWLDSVSRFGDFR